MEDTTVLNPSFNATNCAKTNIRAISDALEVLNGSWKLQIMVCLAEGEKRFSQIAREIEGISDKMLSKELKDLEMNFLVKRNVHDTHPPMVTYSGTEYTETLGEVMLALQRWGMTHRRKVIGAQF